MRMWINVLSYERKNYSSVYYNCLWTAGYRLLSTPSRPIYLLTIIANGENGHPDMTSPEVR